VRAREAVPEALWRLSSSTKAKIANVICGHQRPLRVVVCDCHHIFYFLEAMKAKRRIFVLGVALHTNGDPSGVVPSVDAGGCGSSRVEKDLNAFFNF
jgi:hypothetical protein